MVGLIDAEFVAGTIDIVALAIDAEVFNEQAISKTEVRMPQFREPTVNHGRWLLVNEGDAVISQQAPYLALHARFVLRPSACFNVMIIIHPYQKTG